jgi:hypothetical protein
VIPECSDAVAVFEVTVAVLLKNVFARLLNELEEPEEPDELEELELLGRSLENPPV